ncbi:MAG: 3'-5' exonuclease [Deltaproteobacteria bacterium]|nr:3'-5' exonuclease [Deltaproteobacteria bacterium]
MLFRSPRWKEVTYWALDLETGGLDSRRDPVISIGMVPVREGTIRLGEGYRTLVHPEGGASIDPASVAAHQLVRGDLGAAPRLAEVLPEVERRLREGVLIVHHQSIDVTFLKRDFARSGLQWPKPRVVDTARLLALTSRMAEPGLASDQIERNLTLARREYGLPDYGAHDALLDAVATAELFLVLRKRLGIQRLRDLP